MKTSLATWTGLGERWVGSSPGGGGYSGFQVMGMIEWGQKLKPKKIHRASNKTPKNVRGPKINPPKKSHAKLSSLKNFQKASKFGYTSFAELRGWDTRALQRIFRLFWAPKKYPLKSCLPKNILANISYPKNPGIETFFNVFNSALLCFGTIFWETSHLLLP